MIYLDSAATTLQKPPQVAKAVQWAMEHAASPGRGGYEEAQLAEEIVFRCRRLASEYFDTEAEKVVFTFNATHGLNIAIKSIVPPGGRVLISGWEHNAVTRPLHSLGAIIDIARAPLFDSAATVDAFAKGLAKRPDAAICTHVSNVFGFRLPLERIAELCRDAAVPLIVDASQSAGVLPLSLNALGASFIAMPGHKGLYGPQGSGILLCGAAATPLLEGGTGSRSMQQEMPDFLPDRLEAGTSNVAAIAGLCEGLKFVMRNGKRIAAHEEKLLRMAGEWCKKTPNIEVFSSAKQVGALSLRPKHMVPEKIAEQLAIRKIAVRAGLHCAPLAHESAGTLPEGTVRMSISAFTREEDIAAFVRALRQIVQK